jgi:hypothetical protein
VFVINEKIDRITTYVFLVNELGKTIMEKLQGEGPRTTGRINGMAKLRKAVPPACVIASKIGLSERHTSQYGRQLRRENSRKSHVLFVISLMLKPIT